MLLLLSRLTADLLMKPDVVLALKCDEMLAAVNESETVFAKVFRLLPIMCFIVSFLQRAAGS